MLPERDRKRSSGNADDAQPIKERVDIVDDVLDSLFGEDPDENQDRATAFRASSVSASPSQRSRFSFSLPTASLPAADIAVLTRPDPHIVYSLLEFPVTAPANFSFHTHAGSTPWSVEAVAAIADTLYLIDRVFGGTAYRAASELLHSVPIDPSGPEAAGTGGWNPITRTITLDPESVFRPFEITGILLHESDHALHDIDAPPSVPAQFEREKRAHRTTVDQLRMVEEWLRVESEHPVSAVTAWQAQLLHIIAVQQYGLMEYCAIESICFKVNTLSNDRLESGVTNARNELSRLAKDSVSIVSSFLHGDGDSAQLPESLSRDLEDLIKRASSLPPEFVEFRSEVRRWEEARTALREAWRDLQDTGAVARTFLRQA